MISEELEKKLQEFIPDAQVEIDFEGAVAIVWSHDFSVYDFQLKVHLEDECYKTTSGTDWIPDPAHFATLGTVRASYRCWSVSKLLADAWRAGEFVQQISNLTPEEEFFGEE